MDRVDENAPFDGEPTVEAALTTERVEVHQPRPSHVEAVAAAFRIGQQSIAIEQSAAVDNYIADQQESYRTMSVAELREALEYRDRAIAQLGRDTASGRMGTRVLRELVRSALASAGRDPVQLEQQLREVLGAGAGKESLRQIKQTGSPLISHGDEL
jgi:hypothetical protein